MASVGESAKWTATTAVTESSYAKLTPGPGRLAVDVKSNQLARIHRAMVELNAERGYNAITARGLAGRAGVSTRTFYERFKGGKEECFLSTYDVLVHQVVRRIAVAQAGQQDEVDRLRSAVEAIVAEVLEEPLSARLVLIDAYAAGSTARQRAQRSECILAAILGEGLGCRASEGGLPQLLSSGVVTGMLCLLRAAALGKAGAHSNMAGDLFDWMRLYDYEVAAGLELSDLARLAPPGDSASEDRRPPALVGEGGEDSSGDRQAILSAVAKLAATDGFDALTVPAIRAAAGVPRRRFNDHFDGVEDCFAAAFESKVQEALGVAAGARARATSPTEGVCLALRELTELVANDPIFASICFEQAFAAGLAGTKCHERFIAEISRQLLAPLGSREDAGSAAREKASAGAIWGLLRQSAIPSGVQRGRRFFGMLGYFALSTQNDPETGRIEIKNIVGQNLIGLA